MGEDTRSDDQILSKLRAEFSGWGIWRAVKSDGRLGEWVATLYDRRVGVTPTVMWSTPEALRAALIEEAERAESEGP